MTAQPNPTNPIHRPGANPGDEMLTLAEACLFLRIPEGTLRYWRTDLILWLAEQSNRP
jgi:hypothetical protein